MEKKFLLEIKYNKSYHASTIELIVNKLVRELEGLQGVIVKKPVKELKVHGK